jgi:hypothetical protein
MDPDTDQGIPWSLDPIRIRIHSTEWDGTGTYLLNLPCRTDAKNEDMRDMEILKSKARE